MLRTVCLCTPHTVLRIRHPFLTLAAVSVFSKSVRPWRLFAGLAVGLPKHDRAFAMEEKASEGNVSYFSEYPSADLEPRLVKHRDEDGRSLLHTAAAAGKHELVEFFLETTNAGPGLVNVSDEENWTPLHSACSCGHFLVVTCLLAHGAHADASNSGGQRPAHYASSKGHLQILQKLHEIGADFHAADKTGATPLHRAASTGRVDLVTWIVEHVDAETKKNDLETKNKIGQTPIIVACEAGQDAAVLALARLGAAIDALDDEGNGVKKLAPKLWPVCVSIKQGDVE